VTTTTRDSLGPSVPGTTGRPKGIAGQDRAKCHLDSSSVSTISIIIPTLNEADYLPRTLNSLRGVENIETIIVDGGSSDGTSGIAQREDCHVLRTTPGRAKQLNMGAQSASGSVLLFLHADTRLPPDFDSIARATLDEPGVAGGAFRLRIDAPGRSLRIVEWAVGVRSRFFQMPYGDQGLYVRKEVFHELGGFPELPIMDDFEFVRRLHRRGKIRIASAAVLTSGRRWQQLGPWRTTWVNQKIILGYHLGIPPTRLAAWYHGALE